MARTYTSKLKNSVLDVSVSSIKLDVRGLVELKKKLMALPNIDVGYLNGEKHPTWDFSMAELAMINHEGVRGDTKEWFIPPRQMLRQAFMENGFYRKDLERAVRSAISTKGMVAVNQAFRVIGKKAAKDLNAEVASGNFTPNAEFTIEKKGKDDPLNWTGALARAGKFRLVKRGMKK